MKSNTSIQQAAIRIFLAYGYDKTTMEDIAGEAGVARSTLYTKWKTKEDLFTALLKAESIRFAKEWYRRVEADPGGGSFTGIYKNSLLAVQGSPFLGALFTQNRRILGSFASHEQLAQLMGDRLVWVTTLFKMMQDQGLIRAGVDPQTIARLAVIFRHGLLVSDDGDLEAQPGGYEAVVDLFTEMLRNHIETGAAPANPEGGKQMLKAYVEAFIQQYGGSLFSEEEPHAKPA